VIIISLVIPNAPNCFGQYIVDEKKHRIVCEQECTCRHQCYICWYDKIETRTPDDGWTERCSGDWAIVPEFAIRRINSLQDMLNFNDAARCPKGNQNCPDEPDMSCGIIKHCYPYLCKGSCGHNEIWVSDEAKNFLKDRNLI
jgi:hypothetical protein